LASSWEFLTKLHCQSTTIDEDRHHGTRKFYKQDQVHGFEVSMLEAAKVIVLHYLNTHDMIADFFASPRIGESFRIMREIIMGTYSV
jgi:hypothetical protein